MSTPDPVERELDRLGLLTEDVAPSPALQARIAAALVKSERSWTARWDSAWSWCRAGLALAACATGIAIGVAVWHDDQLASSLATSVDAGLGLAAVEP